MYLDIEANWTSMERHQPANVTTTCVCTPHPGDDAAVHNASSHVMAATTMGLLGEAYASVHGVVSLVVCTFGIPMNVLNITVLTRKHMRTPVNCILTWLAVFDLLTMVCYVPFALHFYCFSAECETLPSAEKNSFGWMTFLIFHGDFTATTHTISNWLGVTLAVFRYKHIFSPAKGHLTRVRRLIRARIAVFIVVVVSILIMIPNYMMNKLSPVHYTHPDTNITIFFFVTTQLYLGTPDVQLVTQLNLWLHSALAKFLPCILMVVYGGLLVKTLRTNIRMLTRHEKTRASDSICGQSQLDVSPEHPYQKQEDNLLSPMVSEDAADHSREHTSDRHGGNESEDLLCANCRKQRRSPSPSATTVRLSVPPSPTPPAKRAATTPPAGVRRHQSRHQDNSRTTRMLLVVITLFLVTEFPQAVLIVLSATIPNFFQDVYLPLGDIMDVVALVNNGINFLLYCIMSRDFRTALLDMMKSSLTSASKVPGKITTTFYRPTATVFDRSQKSHATLIVRTKDYLTT